MYAPTTAQPTVSTWQEALLAAGAEAGVEVLTDIVVRSLGDVLPVLEDDPDLLEAARSSTAANVALVIDVVAGRLRLCDIEPPPQAAAFTRELARRNVPVVQLDQGYRRSCVALWRWAVTEVRARVGEADLATAIEELSAAAFVTGDVFSAAVMERYAAERESWLRGTDAIRAATVQDILDGGPVDVVACSARLRYELRQNHQAFVVWSDDDTAETVAGAVAGSRGLLWPMGGGAFAGWAPAGTLDTEALDGSSYLALGTPGAGIEGFRRSHAEACEARRIARMTKRPPGAVDYDDIAVVALLTHDAEQARRFAERTLGPLAGADPTMRRLAETLRVTLEHQGSPRRAAQVLGVHENTVAKRLRTVEQLLGDDIRRCSAELLAALAVLDATVD